MDHLIQKLFIKSDVNQIKKKILNEDAKWEDGRKTAGSHAANVKKNMQLDRTCDISMEQSNKIKKYMMQDALIRGFTIPKKIHGLMFTKSSGGDGYGTHVDNPYMSSGRSDLSFTLFLSNPEDYEGGELCIQTTNEEKKFKLEIGEMIIYPSTYLHSVEKVTKGLRVVCVGWIESYISSNEERNYLFNLEAGAKGILAKYGRSEELDLIFQSYSNLLRRLGD